MLDEPRMTKPCYKGTKKLKMICDSPIVHLFNESDNPDPEYKTEGAAGFDLAASEDIWIYPDCVTLVPTGLRMIIQPGWEGQVRLRSSQSLRNLIIPNAPGTIDCDYRGEIKIILANRSHEPIKIKKGERVAQMVIAPAFQARLVRIPDRDAFNIVDEASTSSSSRGEGGFGSTGKN